MSYISTEPGLQSLGVVENLVAFHIKLNGVMR